MSWKFNEALNTNHKEALSLDLGEYRVFYFSMRGLEKEKNEDAVLIAISSSGDILLVVADGMGGYKNGDLASKTVVHSLKQKLSRRKDADSVGRVVDGIELAHKNLVNRRLGAGSTVVAAYISKGRLRFFNVGDSVGKLFNSKGQEKFRTIEHSPLGFAAESGITPDEKMADLEGHYVSNALGFSPLRIELSESIRFLKRDRILLFSDGFSALLNESEVLEILASPKDKITNKIIQSIEKKSQQIKGNSDDLTFLLLEKK